MHTNCADGISIIIPTYQEVNNIKNLVCEIANIQFSTSQRELIFVDDNSTDGTIDTIKQMMQIHDWVKLIVRTGKRSLSQAVIDGFRAAKYETLVSMDADLSHPPAIIPHLTTALARPDIDFVIGSRYIDGGSTSERWPVARKLTSKAAASLARFVLGVNVHDPLSGFFALRNPSFQNADALKPIGWKIALELMMKCRCRHICEVPIHFSDRLHDKSKLNWKIALAYFRHIFQLMKYKYIS